MRRLLVYLIALLSPNFAPARSEILVGAPLPVSGPNSALGEPTEAGIQQAIEDLNNKGYLLGKKLIYEGIDDRCGEEQGKAAKAAADELLRRKVQVVIGHPCSGGAIPASSVYAEAGVPLLTYATKTELTERGLRFVFRVAGTDDQQGDIAAGYLAKHFAGLKIAILHDDQPYGQGLAREMQKHLHKRDLKEEMFEQLERGEAAYTDVVDKMREKGIGVIYYAGYSDVGGPLRRQSWAKLRVPMLAGDGIADSKYWHDAGPEAAENTWATNPPDLRDRPKAAAVVTAIKAKYGGRFFPLALYAYAAVEAWAQAVEAANTTEGQQVAETLRDRTRTFETVIGGISFDKKGDLIGPSTFVWYTWRNGNLVPLASNPRIVDPADQRGLGLVCRAQAGLIALGYDYVDLTDGIKGKRTNKALEAFVRAQGEFYSDIIDEALVTAIERDVPDYGPPGWKERGLVCRAQVGLKDLGYPAGPTDGIIGRRTKAALKEFTRDRGMPNTDRVNEELVKAIELAVIEQNPRTKH